jgi:hypothetical protein
VNRVAVGKLAQDPLPGGPLLGDIEQVKAAVHVADALHHAGRGVVVKRCACPRQPDQDALEKPREDGQYLLRTRAADIAVAGHLGQRGQRVHQMTTAPGKRFVRW